MGFNSSRMPRLPQLTPNAMAGTMKKWISSIGEAAASGSSNVARSLSISVSPGGQPGRERRRQKSTSNALLEAISNKMSSVIRRSDSVDDNA